MHVTISVNGAPGIVQCRLAAICSSSDYLYRIVKIVYLIMFNISFQLGVVLSHISIQNSTDSSSLSWPQNIHWTFTTRQILGSHLFLIVALTKSSSVIPILQMRKQRLEEVIGPRSESSQSDPTTHLLNHWAVWLLTKFCFFSFAMGQHNHKIPAQWWGTQYFWGAVHLWR